MSPNPLLRLTFQQGDDRGDVGHEVSLRDVSLRHPEHVVWDCLHQALEGRVIVVKTGWLRAIWPVQGESIIMCHMTWDTLTVNRLDLESLKLPNVSACPNKLQNSDPAKRPSSLRVSTASRNSSVPDLLHPISPMMKGSSIAETLSAEFSNVSRERGYEWSETMSTTDLYSSSLSDSPSSR